MFINMYSGEVGSYNQVLYSSNEFIIDPKLQRLSRINRLIIDDISFSDFFIEVFKVLGLNYRLIPKVDSIYEQTKWSKNLIIQKGYNSDKFVLEDIYYIFKSLIKVDSIPNSYSILFEDHITTYSILSNFNSSINILPFTFNNCSRYMEYLYSEIGKLLEPICIVKNRDIFYSNYKKIESSVEFKESIKLKNIVDIGSNNILLQLCKAIRYLYNSKIALIENYYDKNGSLIYIIGDDLSDILTLLYARNLGLNIDKIIITTKKDSIVDNFFKNGLYSCNEKLYFDKNLNFIKKILYIIVGSIELTKIEQVFTDKEKFKISSKDLNKLNDIFLIYNFCDYSNVVKRYYNEFGVFLSDSSAKLYECYEKYCKTRTETFVLCDEIPLILDCKSITNVLKLNYTDNELYIKLSREEKIYSSFKYRDKFDLLEDNFDRILYSDYSILSNKINIFLGV